MGRCGECGEWNTLVESSEPAVPRGGRSAAINGPAAPRRLDEISAGTFERLVVPLPEVSRVLGGGIDHFDG